MLAVSMFLFWFGEGGSGCQKLAEAYMDGQVAFSCLNMNETYL
jgi:hypothetical protein